MTQLYQPEIFANGATTLPKLMREALCVEAGNTVSYIVHEYGMQLLRTRSVNELTGIIAHNGREIVSSDPIQDAITQSATDIELL